MATENNSNGATAAIAAPATAGEVAPSKGISTAQLAENLGKHREDSAADSADDKEKKAREAATAAANEGQAAAGAAATEDLNGGAAADAGAGEGEGTATALQTLGLNAEQTAAITAVLEKGEGELDPDALKLTPAQVEGLQKLLETETPKGGTPAEEEALDLTQVPKLLPEQARHVGELFKTRLGKVIAAERGKAEAAVKTERDARALAETEVQRLTQQLQTASVRPASAEPLGDVTTAAQLDTAIHNANSVKKWSTKLQRLVERNPDHVKAEIEKAGVKLADYSPEAMESWLAEAEEQAETTLTEHVPKRKDYLQKEAGFNAAAVKEFPWLADPKSPEYADAQAVYQTLPEIKRLPHWQLALGIYAEGLKVVKARQAAAARNGAGAKIRLLPRKTPPKVTVRAGGAARQTTTEQVRVQSAETEFKSSGSTASLAKMFGAKRSAA